MRFFVALFLLAASAGRLAAQDVAAELAKTVQKLEQNRAAAVAGSDGWLFFGGELRLLSLSRFWGNDAAKVSRAHKPDLADPIPAILDFQQQLKARGIELLVVPVPPKASVYPEKIVSSFDVRAKDPAPVLHQFYDELRAAGVDVLDLSKLFIEKREGDLGTLLGRDGHKLPPEKIAVQSVSETGTGAAVQEDPGSPLLLLGDSHTLVYHDRDFLPVRAGLVDQLALHLGFAPDLIGTSGSGATPVRINLYWSTVKDPAYLAKKKMVVWCFAAREFTEATEGWAKVLVAK